MHFDIADGGNASVQFSNNYNNKKHTLRAMAIINFYCQMQMNFRYFLYRKILYALLSSLNSRTRFVKMSLDTARLDICQLNCKSLHIQFKSVFVHFFLSTSPRLAAQISFSISLCIL